MPHISHSQITKFLDCELRWVLERQDIESNGRDDEGGTWEQKAGKVVHTVMEMYHHPQYKERKVEDLATFLAYALEENPLKSPYEGQVKKTIKNFIDVYGEDNEHCPDHVEFEFDVPLIEGYTLAGVFDDVTFDHKNKEVVIGEYKSSLKEIDVTEKVWMTFQPFVYQYAVKQLWPDYTLTAMRYTLLSPKGVERVERPMWEESLEEWDYHIKMKATEMLLVNGEGSVMIPFPNYGWHCKRCLFWHTHCSRKLFIGG